MYYYEYQAKMVATVCCSYCIPKSLGFQNFQLPKIMVNSALEEIIGYHTFSVRPSVFQFGRTLCPA